MSEALSIPQPTVRDQFVHAMSYMACTVSIVTTDGPAGRFGVTVSAMSSVSADGATPTLLVCVNQSSKSAPALMANQVFNVNVLREDQAYIADCFAGRFKTADGDKFSVAAWETDGLAPRLADALVSFDCRILSAEQVGTHYVIIGAVQAVYRFGGSPLIYANRSYGTHRPIEAVQLSA